nr:butirosin biosynthesis, BtrG-like protein [Tanacetum cinerariifolium]
MERRLTVSSRHMSSRRCLKTVDSTCMITVCNIQSPSKSGHILTIKIFDSSPVNCNHSKTMEMGGPGNECWEGMIVKSQVVADVIRDVVNYVCKTKMSCSKTIMKVKQGILSLSPRSRGKQVRFRNQDEEHQQEDDHEDETSIKILNVLETKNLGNEVYGNFLDHKYIVDCKITLRECFATPCSGIMEEESPELLKVRFDG